MLIKQTWSQGNKQTINLAVNLAHYIAILLFQLQCNIS